MSPLDTPGELRQRFESFKAAGLALDMTRGKPCREQLDLAAPMLALDLSSDYRASDGTDCRNYGGIEGIPEARALFADYLGVERDEVLVGGNSSLSMMHDVFARCLLHGTAEGGPAWSKLEGVSFLCPVPGYDRHFSICETFGVRMVPVAMTPTGPDMDEIESLTRSDPSVKGMWIVPRYSNPTGFTVSADCVARMAKLATAAPDFRIFWDDAYAVHDLTDDPPVLEPILGRCREAGVPNRPFLFGSTSKISFAGSGIAVMAGSAANVDWMRRYAAMQTIGPDKLNQLRHLRFFKDVDGIRAHMRRHRAIIAPKFAAVLRVLDAELGSDGRFARWTHPDGGYFISLDTQDGLAARVVEMAASVGVKLTSAGATFPYGKDPRDRNIRLAPTLPSLGEIEQAMCVVAVCVKLATLESRR